MNSFAQPLQSNAPLINRERLWQSLMDLARLGATPKGGVCRLALTDLDRQARDLFVQWCEAAGCSVSVDAIGNIFARRAGRNPQRLPRARGQDQATAARTGGRALRRARRANRLDSPVQRLSDWTLSDR